MKNESAGKNIDYTKNERFWFIELLAYWEGGINTSDIRKIFRLSRQRAQDVLSGYREEFSGNLRYNQRKKRFEPTETFVPQLLSLDVSEYLSWIAGITFAKRHNNIRYEVINHPPRNLKPETIRPIVLAVKEKKRIDVDYLSVSSGSSEGRIIAPHTFVDTGYRWHVRAWCEKSGGFRDFVLSRFRNLPELQDDFTEHGIDTDSAWNEMITLRISADPRLSSKKRSIIQNDYSMTHGELVIQTRAALAQYTLQSLQVHYKVLDGDPVAQQLMLTNFDEVKEWLY